MSFPDPQKILSQLRTPESQIVRTIKTAGGPTPPPLPMTLVSQLAQGQTPRLNLPMMGEGGEFPALPSMPGMGESGVLPKPPTPPKTLASLPTLPQLPGAPGMGAPPPGPKMPGGSGVTSTVPFGVQDVDMLVDRSAITAGRPKLGGREKAGLATQGKIWA